MAHTGRSKRIALLSKKERHLLEKAKSRNNLLRERESLLIKGTTAADKKIQQINKELAVMSRRLSVLNRALDARLSHLEVDLKMILEAESLRPLIMNRSQRIDDITLLWHKIHAPMVGFNYKTWQVKQVLKPAKSASEPSKETKRKVMCYWLDTKAALDSTIEDFTKPEYTLRGIKSKMWWKVTEDLNESGKPIKRQYDVRTILKEAVELEMRYQDAIANQRVPQILSKNEGEAVDIFRIESAIRRLRIKESRNELYPVEKLNLESVREKHEQTPSS